MSEMPIVCALCLKQMPDVDWAHPCPHWEIAEAERELLRSVEEDLAEANEDRYRLTKERDDNEAEVQRIYAVQVQQKQRLAEAEAALADQKDITRGAVRAAMESATEIERLRAQIATAHGLLREACKGTCTVTADWYERVRKEVGDE